jgi:HK97 gp10 family phage protein
MADDIHVTGLAELQAFLDTLPVKLEKNILRAAMRAGANVVREVAQANVPVKSGALRDSLSAKKGISTNIRGGIVTAKVRTKIFYAKWVEYGTRPHTITAKDRKWLSFGGLFFQSVNHPGIVHPKAFMRPALDSQASAAVIAVGEKIKSRLTKEGLDVADVMIEGDE